MTSAFRTWGGRRYLRDSSLSYPLPVDLPELHQQNLWTVLLVQLWGAPFRNKVFSRDFAPVNVLDVACGSGIWTSIIGEYFGSNGYTDINYTGMDVAPLAPHMEKSGLKWRFVQHDMQKKPWPFPNQKFDFVFIKDASLCDRNSHFQGPLLKEAARVLKSGGVVEIWDGDHLIRSLLPKPPSPPDAAEEDVAHAKANGAYIVAPGTGFAHSSNKFVADYNRWLEKVLAKRHLATTPCTAVRLALQMESESFTDVKGIRLALPLSEMRWEKEAGQILDKEQSATRETALMVILQQIDALEPLLKREAGHRQDDWNRWVAAIKADLLERGGASGGECLELGAWWGKKI